MEARWGRSNRKRLSELAAFNRSITYDWEKGAIPNPGLVVAVADALGANRVEALVAADLLNPDEFRAYFSTGVERDLTDEALAAEVLRRMKGTRGMDDVGDLAAYEQAPRRVRGPQVPTGRQDTRVDDPTA